MDRFEMLGLMICPCDIVLYSDVKYLPAICYYEQEQMTYYHGVLMMAGIDMMHDNMLIIISQFWTKYGQYET